MGKNNNSNGYLFLTLILSEIKDLGKQGFTTDDDAFRTVFCII